MANDQFKSIRSRLTELGLWNDDSLLMLTDDSNREVFSSDGSTARTGLFTAVTAPLAVFTAGTYSREFARAPYTLRAATDDAAMMFGPFVRCSACPRRGAAAAILPNRGFVVTGRHENELIAACILLEKMCAEVILSSHLRRLHLLPETLCMLEHGIYTKKYSRPSLEAAKGPAPTEAAPDVPDRALREAVIAYGKKLVEHRLIQATWGNVSVRLDADHFLITPSGVDYDRIRPEDVVEVRISDGSFSEGTHPSSERKMHRLIYAARPDAGAVIHTHSASLQVFAACRAPLHTAELDIPCAPYGVSGSEKLAESVAETLRTHDTCIMSNHGFTAAAKDLEAALTAALQAEQAASELLQRK